MSYRDHLSLSLLEVMCSLPHKDNISREGEMSART